MTLEEFNNLIKGINDLNALRKWERQLERLVNQNRNADKGYNEEFFQGEGETDRLEMSPDDAEKALEIVRNKIAGLEVDS